MTKVNNYDDYAALRQMALRDGDKPSHKYVEKPAMKSVLPNLTGKRILMLGCGTGEESELLAESGGADMVGIDLSAESIKLAAKAYPHYKFVTGDMHQLGFPDKTFDYVYSSLTVHYSNNPAAIYKEAYRVLKSGGCFQFSTGHPVRWASEVVDANGEPTRILGFTENKAQPKLYGKYHNFSRHESTFRDGMVAQYWIGPPSMHFKLLKQTGFEVEEFIETKAVEACKNIDPFYYERFSNFPQFVIFVARKP